ncbi:MAG: 50S ribosomal protein L9 [Candidatus Hydrogenedentota bacterium]|nr:MAG: 50S ribosomal protein L9 [Candidatus Hydrogenedentota bacterium]
MRVILKADVPNLGRAGDEKIVKDGYARNYLIPKNLVIPADAKTRKQQEFLRKMQERKIQKRKKTAEELAASLNGKNVVITVKTGEEGKLFGSVTNITIQRALEKENILVDKKVILLEEPIKHLGHYDVPLKLYEGVDCNIKVTVQDEEGNTEAPQLEAEENSQEDQATSTTENSESADDDSLA